MYKDFPKDCRSHVDHMIVELPVALKGATFCLSFFYERKKL